ncbi:MAG: type VI secretion system baseplate subunit TssE [Planctomycetia bacterium]|nr:type VI secretion system baseplate subunit TssE [Planctomycetia bacterium]
MPEPNRDQLLVTSVLDRLLDDEPQISRDPPRHQNRVLSDLKKNVCRDLRDLLNTRSRCGIWPPKCDGLDDSLANYGLPDFANAHPDEFRALVEEVIRRYEPRFKQVRVRLLNPASRTDRTLRFRIDALLYAEPAPEPLVFDSELEPVNGTIAVKAEGT